MPNVSTLALAAALAAPTLAGAVPAGGYADLIEDLAPAVVLVTTEGQARPAQARPGQMPDDDFFREFRRRFGDRLPEAPEGRRPQGIGSGFVIAEDGLIVTNEHVVDGASRVTVTFADGSEAEAEVLGTDPLTDLALLDIAGDDHPTVPWGTSGEMRVGDEVIAIGAPFGLSFTTTTGIVSATGRNIGSGPYDDFIQTDAAINRGNSGGPLFNAEGEVIGVNTAIISPSGTSAGIGFAVPSDLAERIVADLADDGSIERGWLGVQLRPVTDEVADVLGLASGDGAVVAEVLEDTPAEATGLRAGDIVLTLDGTEIGDVRDLTRAVGALAPGSEIALEVLRRGDRTAIEVTLGDRPDPNDA
ncbi:MAG: S1C family serine protease [Shimia sp.]